MPILHIVRGLPGAGKSTYAHSLGCLVIEPEDNYSTVDGKYSWASRVSSQPAAPYLMAKELVSVLVRHQVDIAIAEVLPTRERVQMFLNLAPNYEHRIVCLSISPRESFRRNIHRVNLTTILSMQEEWEPFPGELCFTFIR